MVIHVVVNLVYYLIVVLQVLFLVRVIASLFFMEGDNAFMRFLYVATEPVIFPFRKLLERSEKLRDFPIDLSFLLAVVALSLIQALLPTSILY